MVKNMAVDFSKFEDKVDLNALQKEVAEAKEFEDVPDGTYIVSIEKMEIVETKAGDKLMFTVSAKVKDGECAGRFLKFFNRVIYGNTSLSGQMDRQSSLYALGSTS